MPRFRNLFDYSTSEETHRPNETLIDIPVTDSVKVITLHFEYSGTVQIRKLETNNGNASDWEVITSFDNVKKMKNSLPYAR